MNTLDLGLNSLDTNLMGRSVYDWRAQFVPAGSDWSVRVSGAEVDFTTKARDFVSQNKVPVAIAGASVLGLLVWAVLPKGRRK